MLTTTLIIVAVIIAAVLVSAATKPDTFVVRRSALIHAAPQEIISADR